MAVMAVARVPKPTTATITPTLVAAMGEGYARPRVKVLGTDDTTMTKL